VWALACFGVGGAVGFLFGVPRTVQKGAPRRSNSIDGSKGNKGSQSGDSPQSGNQGEDDYRQYVNTNLEDISDWITKIIVGLTLVEFRELTDYFRDMSRVLAFGLDGTAPDKNLAFAQGLIVYFTVLGFLCGYLITRLFLAAGFRIADQTEMDRIDQSLQKVNATTDLLKQTLDEQAKEIKKVITEKAEEVKKEVIK
jgi:hypothetical protein